MRRWRIAGWLLLLTIGGAATAAAPSGKNADRAGSLAERDRLLAEAIELRADDNLAKAIECLQRAWPIERKVFCELGAPDSSIGEWLVRWSWRIATTVPMPC